MAKGAKKRRATRKKQEKALLDTQASCPSAKVESCRLEENEEIVFSPKTPVQANEGEDKDRMFDMVGGSASPPSHTEEVVISDGVEYKSGSFENPGFQEFSASGREEVGSSEGLEEVSERNGSPLVLSKGAGLIPLGKLMDWDISSNVYDRHVDLQYPNEKGDGGNGASFDQREAGPVEANKQSEDEPIDKGNSIMERMHYEHGTIKDLVFHDCSLSQANDTTSHQFRDISEGFSLVPSEALESFDNCVERESAMPDDDGVNWLSKEQNGHGKDIIIHNSLCQVGALTFSERLISHNFFDPEADAPLPSESLATTSEKIETTTNFDEGCSMSPFQGVPGSSSPMKLEYASLGGNEGFGLRQEHSDHLKDISLGIVGQDDAETRKRLKDEVGEFYRLTQSTNGSIEKLETYESTDYQAHNISISERLKIVASDRGGLELLQEHDGCGKETDLDNSEFKSSEMLHSVDNYKSDDVAASQTLQNAIDVNLFTGISCEGFCMTSKGVCMSSSQALFDTKNPEQMKSTIVVEHEDPQLLHDECKDGRCLCLASSEHVSAEINNQTKDETEKNVNIQGAPINMLKEYPFFEDLIVSFPATESSVTAHPLVPADLESNKSSRVVLVDDEVTLKGKSNDDNGSDFRDIGEELTQQTHFLKLNGEDQDIHTENTLPGELDREPKATDMILQSKEKLGRNLGFCGVLEFLLCWRD